MDPQPHSCDSDELVQELASRKETLDTHLDDILPVEEPQRLHQAARHLVDAGGKRLRPVTALLVAEALSEQHRDDIDYRAVPAADGTPVDMVQAAYSLELVHTFSLIHDDIMDDDPLRRGVDAVHREYDEEAAILSGDYLYAKSFQALFDAGAPPENAMPAARRLADTTATLCRGQARDIEFEAQSDVTLDEYMEMVRGKTAALYGASAALPADILGADDEVATELYQFGLDVGTAFQIYDDVLDLTAETEALGKERGSDLIERKQTLITLHAREQGLSSDDMYPDSDNPQELRDAISQIEDAGSIEYARDTARTLVERGQSHLDCLPDGDAKNTLHNLSEFLITRQN